MYPITEDILSLTFLHMDILQKHMEDDIFNLKQSQYSNLSFDNNMPYIAFNKIYSSPLLSFLSTQGSHIIACPCRIIKPHPMGVP